MEPLEKVYYAEGKVKFIWLALIVIYLGAMTVLVVLRMIGKGLFYDAGLFFIIGCHFALFFEFFRRSAQRPKVRICDHFLMYYYDYYTMSWSQTESARLEGNYLVFQTPKDKSRKKHYVSFSHLPKEEFLEDIRKICEAKGIPFGEKPQHEVQRERIKFIQWRR